MTDIISTTWGGSHLQSQMAHWLSKMTTAQVVETLVTKNSVFEDYSHPDDNTRQTTDTPGFNHLPVLDILADVVYFYNTSLAWTCHVFVLLSRDIHMYIAVVFLNLKMCLSLHFPYIVWSVPWLMLGICIEDNLSPSCLWCLTDDIEQHLSNTSDTMPTHRYFCQQISTW